MAYDPYGYNPSDDFETVTGGGSTTGDGYDYDLYSSYSQDPEFLKLQAQFSGQYGANFPTFSYEAFLSDPAYAQRIYDQARNDPSGGRQNILNQLLEFFETKKKGSLLDQSGGEIDVEGIFGPLREEVASLTDRQLQIGRRDIALGAQRATTQATEALAGTGLGRSGVAAQGLTQIAQGKEERLQEFSEGLRGREAQAQLQISAEIADKQFQEALRQRGLNLAEITSALNWRRDMLRMQNESMLQLAMSEPTFYEEWSPLFNMIGAGVGTFLA